MIDRYITVWEFRSVDGKQRVTKVRDWHPDDTRYENEYQRIVFRGLERNYEARDARVGARA